jgi:hypothetical protein
VELLKDDETALLLLPTGTKKLTIRVLPLLLLVIIITGCGDHEQLSELDKVQSLYDTQCASLINGQTDAFWETRL